MLQITYQQVLPDILWDPKNPIFNEDLCTEESRRIYAKSDDQLSILCGNPSLSNSFQDSLRRGRSMQHKYFYNIYITDSLDVHNARDGNRADLMYVCDAKLTSSSNQDYVVKKSVNRLSSILPFPIGNFQGFQEGKKYWLFTTSNGSEASLKTKIGPKDSMSIELHMLKQNECSDNDISTQDFKCKLRKRVNLCFQKKSENDQAIIMSEDPAPRSDSPNNNNQDNDPAQAQRAAGKPKSDDISTMFQKPVFLVAVLLALLVGVLLGLFFGFKRTQCQQQQKQDMEKIEDGESPSPKTKKNGFFKGHKIGRQCSTNSQAPMLHKNSNEASMEV